MKKRFSAVAVVFLSVVILLIGGFGVYVGIYYHADDRAKESLISDDVKVYVSDSGNVIFEPHTYNIGLIFYPGGKVEHTAYAPLLHALASEGILCVLIRMHCNLAVLNPDAADGIREQFSGADKWYICGHSLGGAMAATYIDKRREHFSGLILLAAYSTVDLSDAGVDVLSVYGSEDGVLDRKKYDERRSFLPSSYTEKVIDGGCHAYFGSYGEQRGDGKAKITCREQTLLTKEYVISFVYG